MNCDSVLGRVVFLLLTICNFQVKTQEHTGIYSRNIKNYDVFIPRRITKDGDVITSLTFEDHFHGVELDVRKRREISQDEKLFYLIEFKNESLVLELTPSVEFISPGVIVEHLTNTRRTRNSLNNNYKRQRRNVNKPKITNCHFKGIIRGQPNSRVALSNCNGLAGLILSQIHGEYWVEPAQQQQQQPFHTEAPHLIFKRAATVPEHRKRKRKKKRKQEKNCGTREPRRLSEMRLEWQQQRGMVKVQGRGRSRKSRWRRSVSKERQVEALIVADRSMMQFHSPQNVETYLLTIMNLVSSLYQDPSIGNFINIIVVKITLIEEDLNDLNITVNADQTLENFCKWQHKENPTDELHPNHHDVAILVTREDICSRQNKPCGTLGVAHVGGMCQTERSCNVNEDNGITLAHTITHELGHNFGMYHDTEKIGCSRRDGHVQHVMTPSFEADTVKIAWSSCSRRDVTNFLDKGLGECLEDFPTVNNYTYPELPPGAMYVADHQCKLQFGNNATRVCSPLNEICSRLWCEVDDVCMTMLKPAAQGTICNKERNKWCVNQDCVAIDEMAKPVDGGWSNWGQWSTCSRSCGAGVSVQERFCNHPSPVGGGRFCLGERRKYKICNTQSCPEDAPSFRAVQCSNFDDELFNGQKYNWIPYFDKTEPCELYCSDTDETMIVPWGESAMDGTPCKLGTRDMCVRGICKHVGCDWQVDSTATEDKCGICQGNGTKCDEISGTHNKPLGKGYNKVVLIPTGARNIQIAELGNSKNFLGVGSADDIQQYYLNGESEITIPGEYMIAGTSGLYDRDNDTENIHIPGPVKEDILIYIINPGTNKNVGISYSYTIRKEGSPKETEYRWQFSDWSACSSTCGGGTQLSKPVCRERTIGTIDELKCKDLVKPEKRMRVCNTQPCPTRWWYGKWQPCTVTCGDSSIVFRKRSVLCIEQIVKHTTPKLQVLTPIPHIKSHSEIEYIEDHDNNTSRSDIMDYTGEEIALPDSACQGQEKPPEQESCPDLQPCDVIALITTTENLDWSKKEGDFNDYVDELESPRKDDLEFLSYDDVNQSKINQKTNEKKKNKYDTMKPGKELVKKTNTRKHRKIKRKKKEKYRMKLPRIEEFGEPFTENYVVEKKTSEKAQVDKTNTKLKFILFNKNYKVGLGLHKLNNNISFL